MLFEHSYKFHKAILWLLISERRSIEQLANFFIRCLCEILVPGSNASQVFRSFTADDLINLALKLLARRRCSYWHGDDDAFGISLSEGLRSGTHTGSSGQPIID